jgi:hypothetical protein
VARLSEPDDTLWLAPLLAFPVIGFEQVLHTSSVALQGAPLYQTLHWLSDALMALPLAFVAVWSGHRLARRLGHRAQNVPDTFAHALLIALLFALVLVPGAILHEGADSLTHAHARLSIHSHAGNVTVSAPSTPNLFGVDFATHALSDGLVGQAIGLPLAVLALLGSARLRHRTAARGSVRPRRIVASGGHHPPGW